MLVTGRDGQLARCLADRASRIELVRLGRPELDLEIPGSAARAIAAHAPDVVVNAAAYTAVDAAEDEPERAMHVNGDAAGEVAAAARAAGARTIQISTDYVFDGRGGSAYGVAAPTGPLGVYGRSKLAGEQAVRAADGDATILRTAWVYSPYGRNFVRTMLRLAEDRDEVSVVADQHGNPTSAHDLADAVLALMRRWIETPDTGRGRTYHVAGTGEASWAEVAVAVFAEAEALGLPHARVRPIATADYPTRAIRPANSRLDGSAFAREVGFTMPDWRVSLREVVRRLAEARTPA